MKFKTLFILVLLCNLTGTASAGTVTGKIKLAGNPPAPSKIDMASDPACAAQGASGVSEEVVAAADGSLKNVFVYVKDGVQGHYDAPKENVVLDQKGCRYQPRVFGIQAGQTLQIINSDPTLHNVHAMPAASKKFNLGMPIQGMKITRKFDKPEVMVKMKCDVHPWMSAYAGVLTHPFYAVSNDEGTFEIKNLPPGTYTVEAWHEKFGAKTGKVTVDEAGSQTLDFSFAG
jgi:plastocyanin